MVKRLGLCRIIPLFLFFWACGKNRQQESVATHNSFFDSYLLRLEAALQEQGFQGQLKVPIDFGELPDRDILARCIHAGGPHGHILVNQTAEKKLRLLDIQGESTMLDQVLLHEVGHCYFNRRHETALVLKRGDIQTLDGATYGYHGRKGLVKPYIPASLMYPFHIEESTFKKMQKTYLKELVRSGHREGDEAEEKNQYCTGKAEKECVIGAVGDMVVYEILDAFGNVLLKTSNEYEFRSRMNDTL